MLVIPGVWSTWSQWSLLNWDFSKEVNCQAYAKASDPPHKINCGRQWIENKDWDPLLEWGLSPGRISQCQDAARVEVTLWAGELGASGYSPRGPPWQDLADRDHPTTLPRSWAAWMPSRGSPSPGHGASLWRQLQVGTKPLHGPTGRAKYELLMAQQCPWDLSYFDRNHSLILFGTPILFEFTGRKL